MSHFTVLVLTENGTDEEVEKLLEPYDENTNVPEYERPCYCVGRQARSEVDVATMEKFGKWDAFRTAFHERADIVALNEKATPLRDEFYQPVDPVIANRTEPSEQTEEQKQEARKAMKARKKEIGEQLAEVEAKIQTEWEAYIKPRVDDEQAMFAAHPDREKPNPGCEECNGEGTTASTYNPKSRWDWYTVGGRWQGLLDGYDPDDDPENHEMCWLCDGTGMRNDTLGKQQREKDPKYTCNGCQGTGKYPVFPSLRKEHSGDRMRVDLIKPGVRTYAMVTPDGEWHQCGEMGWFGISSNEMSEEEWQKKWDEAIAANADKIAVLVDCHI